MITAAAALERLHQGNQRFVSGTDLKKTGLDHSRRAELVQEQSPFAIILGCSDSRVPAELVFDQGIGDLFVIRVAGNIVAPSQIGSIEFAAEKFGTPLVVVMGHSRCGAVLAALDQLEQPRESRSKNLGFIVDRICPSVQTVLDKGFQGNRNALIEQAVRTNVRASVERLMHGSEILERLIRDKKLQVVGAEYSLETGVVEFFDEDS